MSNFPAGWFYVQSRCDHKMVLDVEWDSTKSAARIVAWPKKEKLNDNQASLWSYDGGYLINKNSGLGVLQNDRQIVQQKRKFLEGNNDQKWFYREDGYLYPRNDPNLVLDIRGNSLKPGAQVLLYNRKYEDNLNQLWDLVTVSTSTLSPTEQSQTDDEEDDYSFSNATYDL
ncbi:hypothetical protein INT44_005471 [Umbelopsis vinacea]|uniref:Ricin B lectin domain-containing protein n=1 Tax=Umbelopsis vinacea TaxID=44442 RepID=A0A8H7Q8J6_9FUNG|nr:hypothetical protein INT44_005471 [Umbelopsis vinacea]